MIKTKAILKGQQGFFLIEICIVIVFLSIALVAIAGMFNKPLQASRISSRSTVAANLAQQAFETLKADDAAYWSSIDGETAIDFAEHAHNMHPLQTLNGVEYTTQGIAKPHSIHPGSLVVVIITVSYIEGKATKSQQYVTYFTKNAY